MDVVFVRLRRLGDIIFTIPALKIFRDNYPHSKVSYVVEEAYREIGEILPGIDELIVVPLKMGIKELRWFSKKIKGLQVDHVVDFHSGPKAALLTFLSGAKTRVGYRTPNRNWAYNYLIPRKGHSHIFHSVVNQAQLLEGIGISLNRQSIPAYPVIHIDSTEVCERVREVEPLKRKVVIHVGAGNRFRDWGEENFASLIKMFRGLMSNIFLVGSTEKEMQRGRYLSEATDAVDFTGRLGIKDLLYLVSVSDLYIGADSGPLHLATLTTTPVVSLFGPNIPEISGPFRQKDVDVLQLNLSCRPCSQRRCIYDTIRCLREIKVERVYETSIKYLE